MPTTLLLRVAVASNARPRLIAQQDGSPPARYSKSCKRERERQNWSGALSVRERAHLYVCVPGPGAKLMIIWLLLLLLLLGVASVVYFSLAGLINTCQ